MNFRISFAAYRFLTGFVYGLLWPVLRLLAIFDRPAGIRERLGYPTGDDRQSAGGRPGIWCHAASVGEVSALAPILESLSRSYPRASVTVSVVTQTGRAHAIRTLPDRTRVRFAPLDFDPCVNRAFRQEDPDILVIVETEIWPSLFHMARRRGIPVVIVNARMSDASFRTYRRFKSLFRPTLAIVSQVSAISGEDARRFQALGVSPRRIRIAGNAKYDAAISDRAWPQETDPVLRLDVPGPIIVAGSTRPGEEEILLSCFPALKHHFPNAVLVLAPRHIHRAEEILTLAQAHRLPAERKTGLRIDQPRTADILILDTMGELVDIYTYADLIFCGGSLVPLGGQNVVEGALKGKPILFGPHMDDFRDAAELLLREKAAIRVQDRESLEETMRELLSNPQRMAEMGARARKGILAHGGAGKAHAAAICEVLGLSAMH